ncbi:MAG: UPF0280 family protein [Burkholderiales bacterium]
MKPSDYTDRNVYRNRVVSDLECWRMQHLETELLICAGRKLEDEALFAVLELRRVLDGYMEKHPEFKTALSPLEPEADAHAMIAAMCEAGKAADVGPMAAVAGAFSAYVADELLKHTDKVIVENGGDICMKTGDIRTVAIYAGASPLNMKVGIKVDSREMPVSVCTSSGTVGPSLSFGNADAAVVVSRDACLADACATRLGNELKSEDDIQSALETVYAIEGVMGAVAIIGGKCGAIGDIELVSL